MSFPMPIPDYMRTAIETHADEFISRANGKGFIQWTMIDATCWWSHHFGPPHFGHYVKYLIRNNGEFNAHEEDQSEAFQTFKERKRAAILKRRADLKRRAEQLEEE